MARPHWKNYRAIKMPKGPRGEKRPADAIARAVKVARIATGEIEDDISTPEAEGKDPAAVSMGKRGGGARAEKMTAERRAEIAKKLRLSAGRRARNIKFKLGLPAKTLNNFSLIRLPVKRRLSHFQNAPELHSKRPRADVV
jgi:hypothetical protein